MTAPRLALLALAAAACSREDLYTENTFTENVARAYEDCNASEIRLLAAKQNLQLAFRECGSNRFAHFSWCPDGVHLYFQLTHGGFVMDGEQKTIRAVPTETPAANAAWVRADVLAVPLPPADASAQDLATADLERRASRASGPYRLALYDMGAASLQVFELAVRAPRDLQPAGDGRSVVFTAVGDDGARRPFVFDPATGETHPFLEWIGEPTERLVYVPDADLVSWSTAEGAQLARLSDHEVVAELPGVLRAIPHPGGRYVALETEGEPVSLFDQKAWGTVSEEQARRDAVRKQQWLDRLPDWAPREMRPPELGVLDLERHRRIRITGFWGDRFEWYRARDYYCSFVLWGVEGKQVHRNVALVDLAERLRLVDAGEVPLGFELVEEDGGAAPAPR